MNGYYGSPLSPDDVQQHQQHQQQMARRAQQQREDASRNLAMINTATTQAAALGGPMSAMADISMSGGDPLNDMMYQNTNDLNRRRSVPQSYAGPLPDNGSDRPLSMMEFGHSDHGFQGFQYSDMVNTENAMTGGYGGMGGSMGMPEHSGPFGPPGMMAMADQAGFAHLSPDMMGEMMGFSNLNVGTMGGDPNAMLFSSSSMGNQYTPTTLGPMSNDFSMDVNVESEPVSVASTTPAESIGPKADDDMMGGDGAFTSSEEDQSPHTQQSRTSMDQGLASFNPTQRQRDGASFPSAAPTPQTAPHIMTPSTNTATMPAATPATPATPAAWVEPPPPKEKKTMYSKSGFDMLRALWYVATRKNAKLNIGAVDMSCSFVVCDLKANDCPIIYVSDNFQNLTGYSRYDIVGRNCRFLQSPTGAVEAGSKREFVENLAVFNLREAIKNGEEIQQSLINYRKGGAPFLNLLTMIPIPWENPDEYRYFIGFQIDLVENPEAVSGDNGMMQVDYNRVDIPPYIWEPPAQTQVDPESGQTLGMDDVSTLLQSFHPKGLTSDWHKQSWDKMLLENADDVIHVLSLKGLFLYISPSCKKILGYDSSEVMGKYVSRICHPSDNIAVLRELKEAQAGSPVNTVYRIRKKDNGYMWFESHGTLFSEQGKGRKCIILVGRKRPVYWLSKANLEAHNGIGDSEIWSKLSTSGFFLYVSSNIRSLLDLQPEDLQGTGMQDLMRKDSRDEFGRMIEKARLGNIATCKHDIQNKRGQVLQAQTTFYPGDVSVGQKPTFLLAQTKLIKASSRAIAPATPSMRAAGVTPANAAQNETISTQLVPLSASISGVGEANKAGRPESNPAAATAGQPPSAGEEHDDDNLFVELRTTRCTSWQYELRQMEKMNRNLAEKLALLLSNRKKRKRRKGSNMVRDCANCHTRNTPEWRRGPSGQRDLCNSCGLRWAKQTGRVSPRNSSRGGNGDSQSKKSNSPIHSSPLNREVSTELPSLESAGKTTSTTTPLSDDQYTTPAAVPDTPSTITASAAKTPTTAPEGMYFGPPQSQPMLEGGSGARGGGMEMTAIQEEREASA